MSILGQSLKEVNKKIFANLKKTKAVFPEEIQLIEFGLALMQKVTEITKEASKEYTERPNLSANHNLFSRNRQLLLTAYTSLLFSSYGTQFVIMRTVLENNYLMREFNKNPELAYGWLSIEFQKRFSPEAQLKYGQSGEHDRKYDFSPLVTDILADIGKKKAKKDIMKLYGQLCNYTHPNFEGWKELVVVKEEKEYMKNMPSFSTEDSMTAVGIQLLFMQMSFKTFVETFKGHLKGFVFELEEWQQRFNKNIIKYTD